MSTTPGLPGIADVGAAVTVEPFTVRAVPEVTDTRDSH